MHQTQTLPGIQSMFLPHDPYPTTQGDKFASTRELTRCPNGELVDHDVVLDGIDALLQLKSAPVDNAGMNSWRREDPVRTSPEMRGREYSGHLRPWEDCVGVKDEESSDGEDMGEVIMEHPKQPRQRQRPRTTTATPDQSSRNRNRRVSSSSKSSSKPNSGNMGKRPPTTWHHRRTTTSAEVGNSVPTPDSPQSKSSVESFERDTEEEEEEETGPAVLHFSCLQCHRAKKRCNRTRPCTRCVSRGMEDECRYPDKHDPRAVLRACLRCWQTKKKCDRKQPSCGKCDKVGVKCVYRRESQPENPESPVQAFQIPTPTLTLSPPPVSRSRLPSDGSLRSFSPPFDLMGKRKSDATDEKPILQRPPSYENENHPYGTRRRESRTSTVKSDESTTFPSSDLIDPSMSAPSSEAASKRILRSHR